MTRTAPGLVLLGGDWTLGTKCLFGTRGLNSAALYIYIIYIIYIYYIYNIYIQGSTIQSPGSKQAFGPQRPISTEENEPRSRPSHVAPPVFLPSWFSCRCSFRFFFFFPTWGRGSRYCFRFFFLFSDLGRGGRGWLPFTTGSKGLQTCLIWYLYLLVERNF